MKTLLLFLVALVAAPAAKADGPCIFAGAFVKCIPPSGMEIDNGQSLRFFNPSPDTHYVEIIGPSTVTSWTMTLPDTPPPSSGKVLAAVDNLGALGWGDPGASTAYVDARVNALGSKQVADLVCHSNVTLSGIQTCDGQSTSGAATVLAVAQTDPTQNGLWLNDDFLPWTRTPGFTVMTIPGSIVTVNEQGAGTTYQDTFWFGHGDGSSTGNYYNIPTTGSNVLLTASTAVATDSSSHLASSSTTATELGYVHGVTSAIQTQLDAKGAGSVTSVAASVPSFLSISGSPITTSGTLTFGYSGTALPIANGGTAVTSVTTAPATLSFAGWDANKNLSANSFIEGYATTATSGGTKTLTVGDPQQQYFTGSTTHTLVLPVTSTLVLGQTYTVVNNSSGVVTVQSSGANTVQAMAGSTRATFTVILTSGTTAASWQTAYSTQSTLGTVTSVAASVPSVFSISGSPVTSSGTLAMTYSGTALPVLNGGTGITSFGTGIATWLGTPSSANLAAALTDETGSGSAVFATSPTLVTPTLGAATATSINFGGTTLSTYTESTTTPAVTGFTTTPTVTVKATRIGNVATFNVTTSGRLTKSGNGGVGFTIPFTCTDGWAINVLTINSVVTSVLWRTNGTNISGFNDIAGGNIANNTAQVGWDVPLNFTCNL